MNKQRLYENIIQSISSIIKDHLNEAAMSLDMIYDKYYSSIDKSKFLKIINADPTYRAEFPDKIGKYGKWLLKLYQNKTYKIEDLYKATNYLKLFIKYNKLIQEKDINKYKTLADLYNVVERFDKSNDTVYASKSEEIRDIKHKGAKKLYEDEKWLILEILNKEAAIYYGKGTQWCTAATSSDNMFDYYHKQGKLYVNIDKENNRKYQFHFESEQYMDEKDASIKNPISKTIGMSDEIVKTVYNDYFLTLSDSTSNVALGNDLYISCKDDKLITSNKKEIYKFKKKYYCPEKLSDDLIWFNTEEIMLNIKTQKVFTNTGFSDLGSYKRQNGTYAVYGRYRDGAFCGSITDKISITYNFRTTAIPFPMADDANELPRYMCVSAGVDDVEENATADTIYDLEEDKVVLDAAVLVDSEFDDTDNIYFIYRDVVNYEEVLQRYNENAASDYYDEEDDDDYIIELNDSDIEYEIKTAQRYKFTKVGMKKLKKRF